MAQDLPSLVRQHALTSRLLGVDFVPAYRRADAHDTAPTPEIPAPTEAPAPPLFDEARGPRRGPSSPLNLSPADAEWALSELKAKYAADAPHAPFIKRFTNIVFGEGSPRARLCFVGEAPGEEEDRQGRPFVGRAGQLLDKMIAGMGLQRADVYICNVLKVRPPDNATPTLEEAAASEPYLLEQLEIVAPEAIVTLGKSASQCLLKTSDAMNAMRGRWHTLRLPSSRTIPVMPTFHPAYLLRSYTEDNRKKVWSDLQQVMARLGLARAGRGNV